MRAMSDLSLSWVGQAHDARTRKVLVPAESGKRLGLAVVAIGLAIAFSVQFEAFGSTANAIGIGLDVSLIAIAAVGTGALLIAGYVDLSIGSMYGLISVLVALVVRDTQSVAAGIAVGVALGALFGLTDGILVRILKISPLIVTIAMLGIYRGFAYVFSDGISVYGFPDSFNLLGRARVYGIPTPLIVGIVLSLVAYVVMIRTVPGLRLYAIGGNRDAATLVGIKADRAITLAFMLNGVVIGIVAVLGTSRLGAGTPSVGTGFELDVLTAVILGGVAFTGGVGHPVGVMIGVATIGILNAGLIFSGAQDWWQQIAKGGLLLLALVADQVLEWRRTRTRSGTAPAVQRGRAAEGSPEELFPTRRNRDSGRGAAADGGAHRRDQSGIPVFRCSGLRRGFGSVVAVRDVGFAVYAGEVVCLAGDNGAGKSTVIRMISGAVAPDAGAMELAGEPLVPRSPAAARAAGIETVYQDLALCSNLGVAHNIVLGREPRRRVLGTLRLRDDVAAQERAKRTLESLSVRLPDLNAPVRRLSGGQRQSVAIARVVDAGARLVILDEPTAALGVEQSHQTLAAIERLADQGTAVLMITHDIETIFAVADRVVVLRLGAVVFDGDVSSITKLELVQLMAGLELEQRVQEPMLNQPSRID
jgi:ribose/xylose/arabinose/galactoside ABC-type transport system permease subunit/ABC-type branched-subunit amino acid transport system ATPase component